MRRPAELMDAGHKRFGDVWLLRMPGDANNVIVSAPELVKQVFEADPEVLGGAAPPMARAMLGDNSVLVLDGSEHRTQRTLLEPAFHKERVQRYGETIARIAERELESWPLNEPFELLPRMEDVTLRSVMTVIFGVSEGETFERVLDRMHIAVAYSTSLPKLSRLWLAQLRGKPLPASFVEMREPLNQAVYGEIERTRNDPQLEGRDDILATLVKGRHEDGSPMSDKEIRDQIVTLLFQGHTSTASALSWAVERLTRNPDVFERLREEARSGNEEYVDAVVKETLRVRPPLPLPTRTVLKPFPLGEYELEPRMQLMVNSYTLHRNPEVYPEPERFRPERFIERPAERHTWIPFGGGTRGCPAARFALFEMRIVLSTLATRARLVPAEQRDEEIRRRAVGFIPSRGARAVLEERVPAAGVADVAAG